MMLQLQLMNETITVPETIRQLKPDAPTKLRARLAQMVSSPDPFLKLSHCAYPTQLKTHACSLLNRWFTSGVASSNNISPAFQSAES